MAPAFLPVNQLPLGTHKPRVGDFFAIYVLLCAVDAGAKPQTEQ